MIIINHEHNSWQCQCVFYGIGQCVQVHMVITGHLYQNYF